MTPLEYSAAVLGSLLFIVAALTRWERPRTPRVPPVSRKAMRDLERRLEGVEVPVTGDRTSAGGGA